MKRIGRLFDQVCSFAALKSSGPERRQSKKSKPRVAEFIRNLEN